MNQYTTITGQTIDLTKLTTAERGWLKSVVAIYNDAPPWDEFSQKWREAHRSTLLPMKAPLYRVCEDLESRLGVSQGEMALSDYVGVIIDMIGEKFGSDENQLCAQAGISRDQLTRVLASRDDLPLGEVKKVLEALGLTLWARPTAELKALIERDPFS